MLEITIYVNRNSWITFLSNWISCELCTRFSDCRFGVESGLSDCIYYTSFFFFLLYRLNKSASCELCTWYAINIVLEMVVRELANTMITLRAYTSVIWDRCLQFFRAFLSSYVFTYEFAAPLGKLSSFRNFLFCTSLIFCFN